MHLLLVNGSLFFHGSSHFEHLGLEFLLPVFLLGNFDFVLSVLFLQSDIVFPKRSELRHHRFGFFQLPLGFFEV